MTGLAQQTDGSQSALWNGAAGHAWVDLQDLLDRMFKPLEELLVKAVGERAVRSVLDIGCGTGATTLAVARALGTEGRYVGIDISDPMLVAARARAARDGIRASFIHGDAQVYAFEAASFDTLISRFGVMFFDDPVAAFLNLRSAAKSTAELHFVAWRSPSENPFMTTAEHVAAPLLPHLPKRLSGVPGQFAFADQHVTRRILEDSGWTQIDIRPLDVNCTFAETELTTYLTRLGPVGKALQETVDDSIRARVTETVRAAFDPYVHGAEVRFTAACWIVSARALS
jgi:ubiquinone/menaquinone biosynthesis C-methylase UbiE